MRKLSLILAAVITCVSLFTATFYAIAKDEPTLTAISFKNAAIDGGFKSDVHNYTITLSDNTASPTLENYEISGEANIFVNYKYDTSNHATGLTVTIEYSTGSKIYDFTYSNPASFDKNSNNILSEIVVPYGELMPKLNDNDTSYTLYIPSDLTTLTITPVTSDIHAYCAGFEFELLNDQLPTITLPCIASNGSERMYTLNVKRVDKTIEQIDLEMKQPGYTSFVEGTRPFEKPEFIITLCSVIGGIIIIALLVKITKRIAINPYDADEKPFYRNAQQH